MSLTRASTPGHAQGKPRKQHAGQYSQQLFAAALDALLLPVSSLLPREWLALPHEAAAAAQLALDAPPPPKAEVRRHRQRPRAACLAAMNHALHCVATLLCIRHDAKTSTSI